MTKPDIRIESVELHVSRDPSFSPKFGAKVRACGGKFSEARGHASRRFVHLPWSERGLVDAIATGFSDGPTTTMIVRGMRAEGISSRRLESVLGHHSHIVHSWRRDDGRSPSVFLETAFGRAVDRVDWPAVTSAWAADDARDAGNKRRIELNGSLADVREGIAAEAVRILGGADDLEPLKELARAYVEVCRELGIELPDAARGGPAP